MPTFSRADRRERLAKDDGDTEDEVIPAGKAFDNNCYHEDETCSSVKRVVGDVDDEDWTTREQAQATGYLPCKNCVLSRAPPSDLRSQLEDPDVDSVDDIDWEAV